MKAVILAGGFGTRLAEYTDAVPKPMVPIGGKPVLLHIMDYYAKFGVREFVIAAGYKADLIKKYFIDLAMTESDFRLDTASGHIERLDPTSQRNWDVTIVDTGLETMTGGRLLRLRPYLDETFYLTYGDGLANTDILASLELHRSTQSQVTVTAVRPVARFGELTLDSEKVTSFSEKPQVQEGWINGGFFVMEPSFLDFIEGDSTVMEKDPLEKVADAGRMSAYMHHGFWQCMDTKRDKDLLEDLWRQKKAPWAL